MAAWERAPVVEDKAASNSGDGGIFNDGDSSFSASLGFGQASLQQPTSGRSAWQSAPLESERPMPKRAKTAMEHVKEVVGSGPLGAAAGVAETGLSMLTGMGGQIAGGLTGAANLAFGGSVDEAADVVRSVQGAMTYSPRTAAGQSLLRLSSMPMNYASEATGAAGEKIGGAIGAPIAGRAIGEIIPPVAATLFGGVRSMKAASEAAVEGAKPRPTTPKEDVTKIAQSEGYVIPPKDIPGAGPVGRTLQAVGGKLRTQQTAAIRNQPITNDLVKQDLGIEKGASIDKESLAEVTKRATEPYRQIEAINVPFKTTDGFRKSISDLAKPLREFGQKYPNIVKNDEIRGLVDDLSKDEFSPNESVFIIRRLREQGNANMAATRIKPDAIKSELGRAQLKASGAMEDLVEERLGEMGQPKLLGDFRAGRRLYAKAMQVAKSTDPSGNVNASALSKALQKGVPLDGNMLKVAKIASTHPKATQLATSLGGEEGLTVFDTWLAGGELAAGHPIGAAAVLLRPTIRGRLALGNLGQSPAIRMQNPVPALGRGAPYAALSAPDTSPPPMVTMGGNPVAQDSVRARAMALQQSDPRLLPMSAFGQRAP